MKTSNEGKVELIGHEGIALSKYKDSVGVWTIAVGATKSEIPDLANWPLNKTITMKEAFDLFSKSLAKYEAAINKSLIREIPQYQFDALVSWCYNVGTGWVSKATVMKLVNKGASPKQLYSALMMFNKPSEIIGRRTKEANLLAYGTYSNKGKAMLFPVSNLGLPVYKRGTEINVWQYIPHTAEEEPVPPEVTHEEPTLLQKGMTLLKELLSVKVHNE